MSRFLRLCLRTAALIGAGTVVAVATPALGDSTGVLRGHISDIATYKSVADANVRLVGDNGFVYQATAMNTVTMSSSASSQEYTALNSAAMTTELKLSTALSFAPAGRHCSTPGSGQFKAVLVGIAFPWSAASQHTVSQAAAFFSTLVPHLY